MLYGPGHGGKKRGRPSEALRSRSDSRGRQPSDPAHGSTSQVERSNRPTGISIGRFTRLTIAFSGKLEQQLCADALRFASCNVDRSNLSVRTERSDRNCPGDGCSRIELPVIDENPPALLFVVRRKGGAVAESD